MSDVAAVEQFVKKYKNLKQEIAKVIVGQDANNDVLGVVFPSDGRLSEKMLLNNNLYRKHPITNEPMGGYFDKNGRIKSLKLSSATNHVEKLFSKCTSLINAIKI